MSAPAELGYEARLVLVGDLDESPRDPGSWSITHGLGGPAGGTYTEVRIDDTRLSDQLAHEVVRRVAVDLYGTAWAFTYPPERFEHALADHGLRRREVVLVEGVEVYG